MKTLLILGAGTGGTMVANHMAQEFDPDEWKIVIVDKEETHYYQSGFLFIPFGIIEQAIGSRWCYFCPTMLTSQVIIHFMQNTVNYVHQVNDRFHALKSLLQGQLKMPISANDPFERKRIAVSDSEMAYVDVGEGDPIVFLHGNPTSSYLWRNIIPHVSDLGRCLAPDLIGMGDSGKNPAGTYRFVDHGRYLDAWFEALDLNNVTLVIHDWGSALGFNWAHRHPERVKRIAYMEAIVKPMQWEDWSDGAKDIFEAMRSPAGEEIVLEKNVFVERILPASIMRDLTDEEMAVYRKPFAESGESRRPTLTWPREIPFDGKPADTHEIIDGYAQWLAQETEISKLFINADPGIILIGDQREFCRAWHNQTEVTVNGLHFIQEDAPDEIGEALRDFISG